MTERVDKYGSAIVYCGGHELVEKIAERLRSTFGLLVSIKRATWETEAGVCNMGIRWLHKLASRDSKPLILNSFLSVDSSPILWYF